MASIVPVRCAQLADVEFICIVGSPNMYMAHLQQLVAALLQQPTRRVAADAVHAFINLGCVTVGGDLRGALLAGAPLAHMVYTYSTGGRPSFYITVDDGIRVLLGTMPYQMEAGRWAVETFLTEAAGGRMDALFGEATQTSYAAAIRQQPPVQAVVAPEPVDSPRELLDAEMAVDMIDRLLRQIQSRVRVSGAQMDPTMSTQLLERSYSEGHALMVENCVVTRELSELREKFERLREARERDVVRLVQLDALGRKYREAFGDIDPLDLKRQGLPMTDLGALQQIAQERSQTEQALMRLQAMEARALTAEKALSVATHELAQAETLGKMWRNQVDFHKALTEAETAKLEALRASTAREIEGLSQWGLRAGEYQSRAERAEQDRAVAAEEARSLRAEVARRDEEIAALRAAPEAALRAEYEVRLQQERDRSEVRVAQARADMKRKVEDVRGRRDDELRRRLAVEGRIKPRASL